MISDNDTFYGKTALSMYFDFMKVYASDAKSSQLLPYDF